MTDNLHALEDWAGVLLARLEPGARRQLNQQIGRELRRSQQQRVASQRNPDGTPYAPRKPRKLRGKVGRIKRQMFTKLRQAAHLKLRSTPDAIAINYRRYRAIVYGAPRVQHRADLCGWFRVVPADGLASWR